MRTLSIAAMQTAPVARDPDATLERLAERAPAVREAVPHAQLLVLPELHLSAVPGLLDESDGYTESVTVSLPGPLTERLGEIARSAGLWIVAGSVYERSEQDTIHNTAIVISLRASSPRATARSSPGGLPSTRRPATPSSPSTSPTSAGSASPSVTTASSPRSSASSPGSAPRS